LPIFAGVKEGTTQPESKQNGVEKNARNIPATLNTVSRRWDAKKGKETDRQKATAPDLVTVYEAPAQIGFPRVATPLH